MFELIADSKPETPAAPVPSKSFSAGRATRETAVGAVRSVAGGVKTGAGTVFGVVRDFGRGLFTKA